MAAAFAEALTDLHKCFHSSTIAAVSKRLGVSDASLSHYYNARRLPAIATLILMYEEAAQDVAKHGVLTTMPFTLEHLLELRAAAKVGLCPSCHRALTEVPPDSVDAHQATDRRNSTPPHVDRRNATSAPTPPPGLDEVLAYIESERLHDVSSVLWATASEVTAEEVAGAVSFFVEAGHPDAADVLLRGAQSRSPQDRLAIIGELLSAGLADNALVLLER
ncbi:hypothetical protein [Amycolatopsis sp. WAC 01376]|uniref:hypothetical protein n=1 Tax=Amycolatopsis sp. WAC 01376 TaxID=2203195 RepID=UPI000F778C23|nr:hypothetical protein [Amycolatopsis sp. WAC 01376]